MQQLGKIFQKFRKARGLSLKEISKAGLSTSQLSRFEHGESDMTITKFMQALDEINLSITELTEYLFEMEYWGHYELLLFMNTLDILNHQSFMLLSREMVRRSDFYKYIPENRYLISMMLLQGYLVCIKQDELTDALYFEQRLKDCFFTEVEIYERLIFYFGKNLYQYKKTENYKSLIEVHKCLGVMRLGKG